MERKASRPYPPAKNIPKAKEISTSEEPFVLVNLHNQIRNCRGCGETFKKPVQEPHNVVIKHKEEYEFFDKATP